MNAFLRVALVVLSIGYFTSAFANLQPDIKEPKKLPTQIHKMYVPLDSLEFSEEGIFLKNGFDSWVRIEQMGYDTQGYFILELIEGLFDQRRYIAKCRKCGTEYQNQSPQPCAACNESKGFDIVYIEDSYWDKNG